jgi:predicted lactoylglutathione lyase
MTNEMWINLSLRDVNRSNFSKPAEIKDWMYGFAFADLAGHRWNRVHMNYANAPKHYK